MEYRLEKPSMEHKDRAFKMLQPFLKVDGGIEGCAGLDCYLEEDDYEGWLVNLENQLKKPDPDYVPHETFFFLEGEKIVGVVNILHRLPVHYKWLGHIGYSIHPQERRQGKGSILLNLALDYCFGLGIEQVMVCPGEHNIPSRKLVESCGGTYLDTIEVNGEGYRRYWFRKEG